MVEIRLDFTWKGSQMRHKKDPVPFLPEWVIKEKSACLQSVAEDAYYARQLALKYGADRIQRCQLPMRAGDKSLRVMEQESNAEGRRCSEGDRAARKYLEAKVCARKP